MQRISVHISEETKQRINLVATMRNYAESELIRRALDVGLDIISPKSRSAQALLDLAAIAEQLPSQSDSPRDVSNNVDRYAWGE